MITLSKRYNYGLGKKADNSLTCGVLKRKAPCW